MQILTDTLIEYGIAADMAARCGAFARLLTEANASLNLTRITDERDMAVKHFLDSLAAAPLLSQGARVVDVGTGAGFPGVPLAVARPDLRLTLVESTGKKADFVRAAAAELGLSVDCVHARAEELAQDARFRAQYDAAVSRAVAALPMLLELTAGFVRVGGQVIAYKGQAAAEEAAAAQQAARTLGLSPAELLPVGLPGAAHALVRYGKQKDTPAAYPRRFAKIKARPL